LIRSFFLFAHYYSQLNLVIRCCFWYSCVPDIYAVPMVLQVNVIKI